ncbi:MAG: NAD-dependent epimerase/dehydratase [Pseudonocardiales bacterium]|nr:NAD-dependent epimerase/dehydratase [Pseudonocardiales bacterium]
MTTAFITGITGQDGGYLTEKLLAEGVEVHGLIHGGDALVGELTSRSPGALLHEGDLTDPDGIARLIDEIEPDEIYNLGGISSVALSWKKPLLTGAVTGLGAGAVLEAAWQLQQRTGREVRVLQASSAEIFGIPDESPQTEATPIRPRTPYGAAKAFGHHLAATYRGRGLAAATCIFYNHESPRRPPAFVTRKITKAAAMIAAGQQDRLLLGTLDVRRDWGWAPDYVDAMCLALRHDAVDDYVIATGESHTIADFVEAAFARVGIADWKSVVETDSAFVRPSDAPDQVGDPTKARNVLGWRPVVSFAELVERMVDADILEIEAAAG